MKFRCSRPSKAADASSIYDLRFTVYDLPAQSMKRQLTITTARIDEAALLSKRRMSDGMGAVVCFLGVVRGVEEGDAISAIEYEAFLRMAEHQFNLLFGLGSLGSILLVFGLLSMRKESRRERSPERAFWPLFAFWLTRNFLSAAESFSCASSAPN